MTCCAAVLLCQELHVLSASGERRREQAQCVLHRQQPQQQRGGVGAGGPSIQGLPRTEEPHRRAQKYVPSLLPHSVSVFVRCVGSSCSYPMQEKGEEEALAGKMTERQFFFYVIIFAVS